VAFSSLAIRSVAAFMQTHRFESANLGRTDRAITHGFAGTSSCTLATPCAKITEMRGTKSAYFRQTDYLSTPGPSESTIWLPPAEIAGIVIGVLVTNGLTAWVLILFQKKRPTHGEPLPSTDDSSSPPTVQFAGETTESATDEPTVTYTGSVTAEGGTPPPGLSVPLTFSANPQDFFRLPLV
jgi:hypothetical protein